MPHEAAGGGGREPRPYFFLSYAHTPKNDPRDRDPDLWVQRFFRDLSAHVMQLTALPAGVPAGFMDQHVRPGEDWQGQITEALALCRVFVPLYSPRYFLSEQCGREWFAFAGRDTLHQSRSERRTPPAIIPALWTPVLPHQLPEPARRLRFNHADFGDEYADEGFYGMIKLNYLRDHYEHAVYRLAKRVVSVAEQTRIADGDPYQDYATLTSAFGSAPGPGRQLEVTVLACSRDGLPPGRGPDCYGSRPQDWNPYHPMSARPLASHTADLVSNLNYSVVLGEFDENAERILSPGPPAAPGLLLLDRWALGSARHRELVRRFSAEPRPWISVMIPWNRVDPESRLHEGELRDTADDVLAARAWDSEGHLTRGGGLPTLEAFSQELPRAVRSAVRHYESAGRTDATPGPGTPLPRVLPHGVGYGRSQEAEGRRERRAADQSKADRVEGPSDGREP
ncbi:TIR-like protein FxsC [Streptomyces sp. CBMA152]|uniref:TIR-like protein FxsC n=1 Tax=Streptomyces sp. CBMA152 TaxID=1896312 RepID=UPI001660EC70|nr:TIR-like protein FxsC [Streptomyces sp. CBMA152]MBD0742457.1 FxsC protein [Streptomyces sp. CBMA152]